MERSNFDRDNISQRSQVGKPLHTYTPTSHENLIKSQLQLDAANKARFQNELRKLQNENDRLKSDLEKALKHIDDKNDLINVLNIELREKSSPKYLEPSINTSTPYEIDGKPLSLDELIDHFNVILQRHHDLLNRKNSEIRDLKDELDRNLPKNTYMRAVETQSSMPNNEQLHQQLRNDFVNEIAVIKKEYEQIENVLTFRNNKLENLIEELQRKLDQYSVEIEKLRKELESRETQPSESTIQLLWEKEKENKHLRELLENLQQTQDNGEIRKIIDDKKDAIDKINEIISDIKKGQSARPDLLDVENDCQSVVSDLTRTNEKLNNVLKKLNESKSATKDNLKEGDLIPKLEGLKEQCQHEIIVLNRSLKPFVDKPLYLKDEIRDTPNQHDPKKVYSSTWTYPSDNLPQTPSKTTVSFIPNEQLKPIFKNTSPVISTPTPYEFTPKREPLKKHKHIAVEPCEACNDADFYALQCKEPSTTSAKSPQRSVLEPLPSKKTDSKLIKEFYAPSHRIVYKERRPKTKRGCCSKTESEFSNYPYERRPEGNNYPQYNKVVNQNDEQLVKVHSPQNINENTTNRINPVTINRDIYHNRGGFRYKPPVVK